MPSIQVLNHISEACILINAKGIITFSNEETSAIFGYPQHQLIGQPLSILLSAEVHKKHAKHREKFFAMPKKRKMGQIGGGIIYGIHRNGSKIPIEVSLSSLEIEGVQHAIAIISDLTTSINEKKEVERIKAIYQSIVENSPDHIFRIDKFGVVEYINHTAPGLNKEDVIGQKLLNLQPDPETRKRVEKVLNTVLKEGKVTRYEVDYGTPLGTLKYITTISPIIEEGMIIGASLISRDQTSEYQLKRHLLDQKVFTDKVQNFALNGIYIYNVKLGINTYINDRYKELLGYDLDEINDMKPAEFFDLFHPNDRESIAAHMEEVAALKPGQHVEIEYRFRAKKGNWIWCLSRDSGFEYDETGKMVSFIGSFLSIDPLKKIQLELLEKNNELENFVAITSHDIKTPLQSLTQILDMVITDLNLKEDHKLNELLNASKQSAERMRRLVDDLLIYSKIERELTTEQVDIGKILSEVLVDLKSLIDRKEATVTTDQMPTTIVGNSTLIRQLFQNLIGNGIKYSKQSPIIHLSYSEFATHHQFTVKDNGIGIPTAEQHKVFKAFERLNNNLKEEGTGLGLANCHKIVNLHKGNLWFKSRPDHGSTFFFTISKSL